MGNDGVSNSGCSAHHKRVRTEDADIADEADDDTDTACGGKRVGVNEQFDATPLTDNHVREVTEEDIATGERAIDIDSAPIEVAVFNDEATAVVASKAWNTSMSAVSPCS